MARITAVIALAFLLGAGSALAHHEGFVMGTVQITHPVLAGGELLQPGTYDIRDTGEHIEPLPGQSDEALSWVEFMADGKVVARAGAEILEAPPTAVGTSGRAGEPVVQMLRGGDFLRVSTYHEGARYLIHLPVQR